MVDNNVQNIKFLRNGSLFATREAARTALNEFELTYEKDGTAILARYGSDDAVKTLVGWVYANNSGNKSITIFDIDDAGTDAKAYVDSLVGTGITSANTATSQLEALSGNNKSTSAQTSVEGAKRYADGLKDAMDYTGLTADENKVVYNVTEADGIVAAEAKNISSVKLAGYAVGSDDKIAATDTLGEALGKLQGQINGMDLTDTAVEGNYVSKVDEADGKITVKRVALPTVAAISETGKPITAVSESLGIISASTGTIDAQYVTTSTANTDFTGKTVQAALEEISSKVKADKITSADKTITVTTAAAGTDVAVNIDGKTLIKNSSTGVISSDLKIKSITPAASSAYASQYQLVYGSSETPIGDVISVGKDQFLKEADYDPKTQTLVLTMWNSTGGTTDITVDFSEAIIESEAGDGLYTKADHSLNVGIDAQSEAVITGASNATGAVLSVSADSIKVQNIQNAIDYKVSTLDATVGSITVASDKHVAVQVSEADGVLTAVTVTERDIANATDLSALSAKSVTAVEMIGGTAAIAANSTDGTKKITINADGASVKATGYSKGSDGSAIIATDSINAALSKLENQVDAAKSAATTVVAEGTDAGNNMSIVETAGDDGHKIFTVNLSDVASAQGLANEIAARKDVDGVNGDAYTADTNAHYISDASSLYGADQALDRALKAVDDAMLTGVVAGDGITVSDKEGKSQTISVKVKNNGGIVNDATGLHLSYIDAGIY